MTLEEKLTELTQSPQGVMDFNFSRYLQVANQLAVRYWEIPVVIVAGTNGKGSVLAAMDAIYAQAGYRRLLYTSPHLHRLNERIVINGVPITDDLFLQALSVVEQAATGVKLTFFEWVTLTALQVAKQSQLDVLLLEIGMGGRLDAVNVVEPDVSVVTSIGLDHMEFLGDTREAIAAEKAGVFRENGLAVCGDPNPPRAIIERAAELNANLFCFKKDYDLCTTACNLASPTPSASTSPTSSALASPTSPGLSGGSRESADNVWTPRIKRGAWAEEGLSAGSEQVGNYEWQWQNANRQIAGQGPLYLKDQNIATALQAVDLLDKKLPVTDEMISTGLSGLRLAGRMEQRCWWDREFIFDVAHNPQATTELADQLLRLGDAPGRTWAIFSVLASKDWQRMLEPILTLVDNWLIPQLAGFRAAKLADIEQGAQILGIENCQFLPSTADAWRVFLEESQPGDRCLVFGSFVTVGAIQAHMEEESG